MAVYVKDSSPADDEKKARVCYRLAAPRRLDQFKCRPTPCNAPNHIVLINMSFVGENSLQITPLPSPPPLTTTMPILQKRAN